MILNYYKYKENISKNLILFIRKRGYSRLSLSKLTNLSRSTIDQLLTCKDLNQTEFNTHIRQINQCFDLSDDYLIREPTPVNIQGLDQNMSPLAVELLEELDTLLDIFSMYLK